MIPALKQYGVLPRKNPSLLPHHIPDLSRNESGFAEQVALFRDLFLPNLELEGVLLLLWRILDHNHVS